MGRLLTLYTELSTDPLARGYSGMTPEEAADDLNTLTTTRELEKLSGGEVYEQVDITEFQGLTADQQTEVWNIVHLGAVIDVTPGSKARARFVSLFGGVSATITNLQDYITENISRAEELGLGIVTQGDVEAALALGG